jgi:cobalt-zinc-cadmium efflux system outer membrane protein
MIRFVRRLTCLIAIVAASCIRYVPKPIDVAATAASLASRTLDVAPPFTFAKLTETAMRLNADVAVARADYEVARAALVTAGERPNPTVNASLQRKDSDPGLLSPWISNFGIDLPLEFPSKRRARLDAARESAYAALARVGGTMWQVRSRLRARMLDTWAAAQRQQILGREEAIQRDIVEAFTKRVELGEAAHPDLSRARIALIQTTLLSHDARRLAAEARAGVAAAIGVPESALGTTPIDAESAVITNAQLTDGMRDMALRARPDIVAALHDYAAADAALRGAVAAQYPDLHLTPAFGWDQGTRTWTLGAAAEIPLLNQHRGPIGEAAARRDAAAARVIALQASIIAAFDVARATLTAAREKLDAARSLLASEEEQLRSTQRQFNAGEIDRVSMRSTELEAEAARLAVVDATIDEQAALGAVEDAAQWPAAAPAVQEKP